MNKYIIYCTPEQTKKALELGAPIKTRSYRFEDHSKDFFAEEGKGYFIPTVEQMIGWLEEQKIFVYIEPCFDICCNWHIASKGYNQYRYSSDIKVCKTRKKATLAAIDAALDYLSKNK